MRSNAAKIYPLYFVRGVAFIGQPSLGATHEVKIPATSNSKIRLV